MARALLNLSGRLLASYEVFHRVLSRTVCTVSHNNIGHMQKEVTLLNKYPEPRRDIEIGVSWCVVLPLESDDSTSKVSTYFDPKYNTNI